MNQASRLTIVNTDPSLIENGLQVGFSIEEMALRVEQLLRSIGLIKEFAPIVYIIGHGSSSVNNPYYSTMDCGACSCKPGSVNARVFSFMANHPEVRKRVAEKGINIPLDTQFEGGLHDTTRDEMMFFDEEYFDGQHLENHLVHVDVFKKALEQNAKERSRRFDSIDSYQSAKKIHSQIKTRSVSIFEPRPELDHATNALAIIGSRALTAGIFFDRRAFLNSYAYQTDLEGKLLYNVLLPIGPVCGGINLNYYFSRVDNEKLGASSKLPHNVMGLIGVSNGTDGDLRPGLPSQMVELHDPIRLMVIIEHFPSVIEEVLRKSTLLSNWYANEWMYLVTCEPETKKLYYFKQNHFVPYEPLSIPIPTVAKLDKLLETSDSRVCIPVHYMKK